MYTLINVLFIHCVTHLTFHPSFFPLSLFSTYLPPTLPPHFPLPPPLPSPDSALGPMAAGGPLPAPADANRQSAAQPWTSSTGAGLPQRGGGVPTRPLETLHAQLVKAGSFQGTIKLP